MSDKGIGVGECVKHGEYFLDAADSPCPSCEDRQVTTLFKGEFVLVDLVDETIELTVENNVYSRSESLELLEELKRACAASRFAEEVS